MNQKLEFSIDSTGKLELDLSRPPPWLAGLVVKLPSGRVATYHFTGPPAPNPQPLPPAQLVQNFLDHLEVKENLKPHTRNGYRLRLGQFARWLENHPSLWEGLGEGFLAYYAGLKRHKPEYSPNTLRNHYDALTRFSRWLFGQSALADVERPSDKSATQAEPRAIERRHINQMLRVAREPRDRALLLFFRDSGCRADEALQLTWGKLNLEERKTEVVGKGDKARKLFFKPLTRRALEAYRASLPEERRQPAAAVWWGKKGRLTYDGLYKAFKRLAKAAGLGEEVFNPHAWRHAFGRDTTIAGIPTAQLQDLLGHASIETTKRYAVFNTTELQQAHDRYSPVDGDLSSPLPPGGAGEGQAED
ncbi:MAG: tyrosine recombinase XerC [Chloroflexota bacterium]|nr:MAG: tyrosine recombinase XerC [Chloroflexota bacterium]